MKNALARLPLASVLVMSFAFPALAAVENYELDPNHTNVYWHASHFGFSSPSGKFAKVEGTLKLDEAKPENSKVSVTIHTGSVMTGIEKFDTHLKSPDFFNSEKFPTATFVSDTVNVEAGNTATVHGKLTLHGVTKPAVLKVNLNKIGENPATNRKTAGFSASAMLKRSDFGMTYGLPGVADDVRVTIESEAALQVPAAKP